MRWHYVNHMKTSFLTLAMSESSSWLCEKLKSIKGQHGGEAGKHWMKTEETYKSETEGIWQCDDDDDDIDDNEDDDDDEDLFAEVSGVRSRTLCRSLTSQGQADLASVPIIIVIIVLIIMRILRTIRLMMIMFMIMVAMLVLAPKYDHCDDQTCGHSLYKACQLKRGESCYHTGALCLWWYVAI